MKEAKNPALQRITPGTDGTAENVNHVRLIATVSLIQFVIQLYFGVHSPHVAFVRRNG